MEILRSKIKPPKRQHILHRKRLIRIFGDFREKKLTTVIAGAGYGKTTLLWDAMSRMGTSPFWYRLGDQDTDFKVFVSYLYACFNSSRKPAFGLKKPVDMLHSWLAFIEKRLTSPTVLVFDDFHLVQKDDQIMAAVEFILDRLPSFLHLVIIGRHELPLRLSRLRAQDQLVEIDETDLSFTTDEIRSFFERVTDLADGHIDDIAAGTGGWAAGLVLLRHAFKNRHPDAVSERLKSLHQAPRYIFSYLRENVFDTQPDHVKAFMMKIALLPEIDTRLCSRIFHVEDADAILKSMVADHLMIFPVDESGTVFSMHHLLQDFLVSELKQSFPQGQIDALHIKIAEETEACDSFLALTHYIEGRAYEKAVRLIETHEMEFLIEGKVNFLGQCLSRIPEQVIEANPRLLLAQAKLYSYFGNPRKATDLIVRAHQLFKKQNAKEEMISCLVELGSQYYFTGHVKEAKLLMEQVLEEVEPRSATYVVAMTYLSFLSSVLGEFHTAHSYYDIAVEVIDGYPELERRIAFALLNTSFIHLLYFEGDFEGSHDVSQKLLNTIIELNIHSCLPLVYYQLSINCYLLEAFEKGCAYAELGITACEKMLLSDSRKGWVYLAFARNTLGLGQTGKAEALVHESMALFEDPGNRWGMAHAWECLHLVHLKRGNLQKAHKLLNNALDIIKGYGLHITKGILLNSLAKRLIIEEEPERALALLSEARSRLKGAEYYLFNNHLLTVRALDRINQPKAAVTHLDLALRLSKANGYTRFLKREKEWFARLLKDNAFTDRTLYENHKGLLERLFDKETDTPVLRISLLGPFWAVTGNTPIPPFKSANALMILKYLAANRQRGFIHKEELIELIWPDENPEKTGSRFNMAMSALRKTLEPDLPARAASTYIERKKDSYRLYGDDRAVIDAERFSRAAAKALKAPEDSPGKHDMLLAALSIYTGPFLEEDRYQDWCMEKNQTYTQLFGQLLNAIADSYERKNDIKGAVLYTRKRLNLDPLDEAAFEHLMHLYSLIGDRLKVSRTYQEYQKTVKQMELPVNPELTAFFRDLIQSG